jgi:hypothetical protein
MSAEYVSAESKGQAVKEGADSKTGSSQSLTSELSLDMVEAEM